MCFEELLRRLADPFDAHLVLSRKFTNEMLRQKRNILDSITQGGQGYLEDRESIE